MKKLNLKLKKHKIDLPSAVLTYRILNNANVGQEREQVARATLATYSNMKDQIRKIFDETCLGPPSPYVDQDINIESDSSAGAYYGNNRRQRRNCGRGRMRGRMIQREGYMSRGHNCGRRRMIQRGGCV